MKVKNGNIFEQTMNACQTAKKVESKRKVGTRVVAGKKRRMESRNIQRTGRKFTESEEIEDLMDETTEDLMVVVDPEVTIETIDEVTDELQEIIDETPEGEIPTDDKYVDEMVLACPVCGNNFFSEELLGDGDVCPICGEVPEGGFVAEGAVEEVSDELIPAEDEEIIEEIEDEIPVDEVPTLEETDMELNESRLNKFLTKLVEDNFKNAKGMQVVRPVKSGNKLCVECAIRYKNGKMKRSKIVFEGFRPKLGKFTLTGHLDSAFKAEASKRGHIVMECSMDRRKTINVEKFSYNFNTKFEGRRYNVAGKLACRK